MTKVLICVACFIQRLRSYTWAILNGVLDNDRERYVVLLSIIVCACGSRTMNGGSECDIKFV